MRRSVLVLAAVAVACLSMVSSAHAISWKYPVYSVAHASDGLGFTNGSLSLHRVFSSRHAMFDSYAIYGATYTWPLPATSTFLTGSWGNASVTSCGQCHTYISMGGSTPASGFPDAYATLRLDGATANGMSSTTVICAKCHDLVNSGNWSNIVHGRGKHRGVNGECVKCHVQLPHGSGLPRLLGYSGDPSPYSTVASGLAGIVLQSYTPTSWKKSDCFSPCHGSTVLSWPSGGSVAGTIRDGVGNPIGGAKVQIATLAATTALDGTYRIDALGAGYANVYASKSGYPTVVQSVMITAGSVLSHDATLSLTP